MDRSFPSGCTTREATHHPSHRQYVRNSSCMQKQAKAHASQSPHTNNHEKFETSPHHSLAGIAGFDRFPYPSGKGCESVSPPSGLREREKHRQRRDEATNYKGETELYTFPPRIDVGVFDSSQLVM